MARCPFAQQMPISGTCGSYVGGPFRIIHHTTEGPTASAAFSAFRAHRTDPHFTVDSNGIFQHIDTGVAARALRNLDGGVQTNRWSAVQIEVVGSAGRPKARPTLENVARLCRWIERTHNIPRVWPAGPPKPAVGGADPGGHNRNPSIWTSQGGHYGHSNVPENIHWDPAYSAEEATFVLAFDPDSAGLAEPDPVIEGMRESFPEEVEIREEDIAIPDHSDLGEDGPDQCETSELEAPE